MNQADPTSADSNFLSSADHALTLEEVAAIQAGDTTVETAGSEPYGASTTELNLKVPTSPPTKIPHPPPLPRRLVSGRYLSGSTSFQLELRVDVDGKRPMTKVSGDFFQVSGSTRAYAGSFVVDAPAVAVQPALVTIDGVGRYTFTAGAPRIHISIPRTIIFAPPAPASVQFFTLANQPGAQYTCQYEGALFRTVTYELDRVADVSTPVFTDYNTGSFPSGGPARDLSVISAYAEAGIELQATGGSDVIPIAEENWDPNDHTFGLWDDAELHHSMEKHFSLWRDLPQWAVWEVVCKEHVMGPGLYGIMFDQEGKQRQGCAVFHEGIGGLTPDKLRLQLYTYVHELGHCFNLLHSWQKSYATPPQTNRPSALSWMNYPWNYPGGDAAFWSSFAFQFDDPEIIHLRHAFLNDIVMGGNDFGVGAALDRHAFDANLEDNSGLKVELSVEKTNKSFLFGEPVMIKVKLTGREGRMAHPYLHPNCGLLQLGICKPNGDVLAYRPIMDHCMVGQSVMLGPENPSLEEIVYCGYGKDGFYFDRTGFYQVRAVYNAPDGSRVLSNILRLRVRHPVTAADEEVADLLFGQDQGTLLYLQGSDSEFLQHGNDCLNTIVEKYPSHPLATYVRWIQGINAGRVFKTIDTKENKVRARRPKPEESIKLLSLAVEASEKNSCLDSITLDRAIQALAGSQLRIGDTNAAEATQKHGRQMSKKHNEPARVG